MDEGRAIETRAAARAVLLDEADRILLVRFSSPEGDKHWWATVGGGLKVGEDHEEALVREVREETGLRDCEVGPWVWTREHTFEWRGRWLKQEERFYVVRATAFDPVRTGMEAEEAEDVSEVRWWTLGELESSKETTAPSNLARLLGELLEKGVATEPRTIGI
jgi:ADP-ribose pyrophosphatase YjhB (NUDIX family)